MIGRIVAVICFVSCFDGLYAQKGIELGKEAERYDYGFESSTLMKKLFYPRPHRMALLGRDMNLNGAWGKLNEDFDSSQNGKWYIEQQRYAADAVIAGIVQDNVETIDRGLVALEWGGKQQQGDGSFACPDNFHSTSFFVEAVAHSCILLRGSKYYARFADRVEKLKAVVAKTVEWMLLPETLANGKKRNAPYTHRRYLVGAAIGEAGVLCGNSNFIEQSGLFIKEGLMLQDTAGFNPEKQGYDCSYHAVGLVFAHRYFDMVANAQQKAALLAMYDKGIKWLLGRVNDDGTLNVEGNTRTGSGQEKTRDGKVKGSNYGAVANAILWWGIYKNDLKLLELAERVYGRRQ